MIDPSPSPAATDPRSANKRVHFIGICGKAMGGIAAALADQGWSVSGSDEHCYAPMKDYLAARSIVIASPYAACNVPPATELVVVGKRVSATNPELLHVLASGLVHCSFPQFLQRHFLSGSRNAVVAGGVGKTTTTAILAWLLEHADLNPDYLIGGEAENFPAPTRLAQSRITVLEGDEYAACFDDPQPKFLHYQPELAIVTNILEDHPDLYGSFDHLCAAFARLIATLPTQGCLVIPDHDAAALKLSAQALCRTVTVGCDVSAQARITELRLDPTGSSFRLLNTDFTIPMCGRMNVSNAAMAVVAAVHFGVPPELCAAGLRKFLGVRNRQEEHSLGRCTLVCDKATHPHSLAELAQAVRQRFPGRRLVSVIQPRATGGKDWIYQRDLPTALSLFDKIILTSAYEHNPQQPQRWDRDPFCLDLLAAGLAAVAADVTIARTMETLSATIATQIRDGDVIVLTVLEQSATIKQVVSAALLSRGVPTALSA